jgi:hypothetical protein
MPWYDCDSEQGLANRGLNKDKGYGVKYLGEPDILSTSRLAQIQGDRAGKEDIQTFHEGRYPPEERRLVGLLHRM